VWYYLPAGYADSGALYPVVYILDGGTWVEGMSVPRSWTASSGAQGASRDGRLRRGRDRQQEYSRNPRWRQFMTTELVPPWTHGSARFRHRTSV
jgi:enterochelin esterase-like enzyme